MPDHRLARSAAGVLLVALLLSACSLMGPRRSPATNTAGISGRPPVALSQMDAAAVAIFNLAAPYNRGTSGASGQDTIGRAKPNTPAAGPGGVVPGVGTGIPGTAASDGTGRTGTATPSTAVPSATPTTNRTPGTTIIPGATATAPGRGTSTAATGSASSGTGTTGGATGAAGTKRSGTRTRANTGTDWGQIDKNLATVAQSWTQVRGDVSTRGASNDLVTAVNHEVANLTTEVHRRTPLAVAMAANDLSGYDAALLGLYRPGTPVQIYQLEFMAREIQLDAAIGRTEAALDLARSIAGVWSALRGPAMARNKGHAAAIDGDVGLLAKAGAENLTLNLQSEAATLLRDLHTLTRDFTTATR